MTSDPFITGSWTDCNGRKQPVSTVDGPGRMNRLKSFTLDQCQAAIDIDDKKGYLQKNVRRAIEARIRKLQKEAAQA